MRMRAVPITLAALAALFSVPAAQAGMNNINVNPALAPRAPPAIPDARTRSLTIDTQLRLNCYPVRERDERGAWMTRTRCN